MHCAFNCSYGRILEIITVSAFSHCHRQRTRKRSSGTITDWLQSVITAEHTPNHCLVSFPAPGIRHIVQTMASRFHYGTTSRFCRRGTLSRANLIAICFASHVHQSLQTFRMGHNLKLQIYSSHSLSHKMIKLSFYLITRYDTKI